MKKSLLKKPIGIATTICLTICFFFTMSGTAQLRVLSVDYSSPAYTVKSISFYSGVQGYVAFNDYIGFTTDSGRTFTKNYLTNINYNGYSNVNFLYGFKIKGVKAFDQNNVIVYGDFGFEPAILVTSNGGNSWLLTYHSQFDPLQLSTGIMDMLFPQNGNTGYAVDADRILKTTDRGANWSAVYTAPNSAFDRLSAVSDNQVYAVSDASISNIMFPNGRVFDNNKIIYTVNAGAAWQKATIPAGAVNGVDFYTSTKGFISIDNRLYYTTDLGISWVQKNKPEYFPAAFYKMKFFNDSLGYGIGGNMMYQTKDSGRSWEPLTVSALSADYVHLEDFYFRDKDLFWVGGYANLLAITANGGGLTKPKAIFNVDLAQLETDNIIRLTNFSKKGYAYKWFRNSIPLATTYDASYVSERLFIDTVKLVVSNGTYADTALAIIDTRQNQFHCSPAFTRSAPDTASVNFTALDSSYSVRHYWNFGDGIVDSTSWRITHNYNATGNYTIVHRIYSIFTGCSDSTTTTVTISRLRNCLVLNLTAVADSFYTSEYKFRILYDTKYESNYDPVDSVTWDFGDNTPGLNLGREPKHTFDSSKYYTVCVSVKNRITGCRTTLCKPVFVFLEATCAAYFTMPASSVQQRIKVFEGKPNAVNKGKRNTWLFDNKDTIVTGNNNKVSYSYFETGLSSSASVWATGPTESGDCQYIAVINIDSLDRQVKHIQYDSASNCVDSAVYNFRINTAVLNPRIEVIQDPEFANHFTYRFYETRPCCGFPEIDYNTRYGINFSGSGLGYGCGYGYSGCNTGEVIYRYGNDQVVEIAAPNGSCSYDRYREVYYKKHPIKNFDTCVIYPPKFSYKRRPADPGTIDFFDSSYRYNHYMIDPKPAPIIYFGDGDSLSGSEAAFTHTYKHPGTYNVTMTYRATGGCSKTLTKQVLVPVETCAGGNTGIQSSVTGTSYQWQVNTGAGFVNITSGANYSGTTSDSLIITAIPASWSGYHYRCIVNGGTIGSTVELRLVNTWNGNISTAWENPANWSCGKIPDANSYVKINGGTIILSASTTIRSLELNSGANFSVNSPATLTIITKDIKKAAF